MHAHLSHERSAANLSSMLLFRPPAEDLSELRVTWTVWISGRLHIAVSHGNIEPLRSWRKDTSRVMVTTDASTRVRGVVFEGIPASWLGSEPQSQWHINHLELEAVFLALKDF